MLDVDLDFTERRLKEQEEDTERLMAQIDQVNSVDLMSKINEMYKLANMDPNVDLNTIDIVNEDINIASTALDYGMTEQLNEDLNDECMEWNINDVLSQDE